MRKSFLLSLLVASSLFALDKDLEQVKYDLENNTGLKNFNTKVVDVQKLKDNDGWYSAIGMQETQQGSKTFSFTTNKKVIIFGEAYNVDTENFSIKTDFSKFKKDASYSIGNGDKEYYLITDPECPFCKQLEEKLPLLKDKVKIYVYLTADVIPTHWLAKGTINYINSLPVNIRDSESRKLFLEKDMSVTIKKVDKYNLSLYKNLKDYSTNPQAKKLSDMYYEAISKAFKVDLSTEEKKMSFLDKKIDELSKVDTKSVDEIYNQAKKNIDMYFNVNGTPTIIDAKTGKKLSNQFEMFAQNDVVDLKKIKDVASNKENTVVAGKIGAKKVYYFLSTQCFACVQDWKDEARLKKLLDENEVHFLLGTTGGNIERAQKELKHILSISDGKERFEELNSIMKGKKLDAETLNKKYDSSFDEKIEKYQYDLFQTLVMATPTIINETGKNIR